MLLAAFVRDGWSGCLRRRTQLSAPGRACISERLCTYIISNQRYSVTITIITITNLTSNNLTSNNKLKRKSTDSLKKILYCNISFFTYFGETEKSLLLDVRLLDVRWHVFGKTMFCNCNYCNCNAVTGKPAHQVFFAFTCNNRSHGNGFRGLRILRCYAGCHNRAACL